MKIGFIGTGVMGASMARHLMDAGHKLTVYNRTKAKAEGLLNAGPAGRTRRRTVPAIRTRSSPL